MLTRQEEVDKIERYIKGISDDLEKTYVESLFLNGEKNLYLLQSLERDWDKMLKETSTTDINLSHLLDKVYHTIRKNETLKWQKPLLKLRQLYTKAAAILLLPLILAGGMVYSFLSNQDKSETDRQVSSTIYSPMGSRVSFNLPDGTKGMLNGGSSISYSLPFASNRQVKLEGEAWLVVSHDEDHPFKINTGTSSVKVLGTSFNLSAYPIENYVEVVLDQGSMEFHDDSSDTKVILLPSERLVFKNGNLSKSVTDPSKYTAWTEGKLVFRGDPMVEVARRIERWYNVKVELADKELEKYSFRATFQDDSLEEVLRFLSMTSPIRYKITPRSLMPDGTYKKEEVTIYLR